MFLEGFRREYNARFWRAPASDHNAHRKLINVERVRIDDIFSWQESRAVTRSLTLQYDKVIYMIKPGPENDKIAGQHVTVFDYPDGRSKIRYEGRECPTRLRSVEPDSPGRYRQQQPAWGYVRNGARRSARE